MTNLHVSRPNSPVENRFVSKAMPTAATTEGTSPRGFRSMSEKS
jgi:hypothetical protein